MVLKCFGGSSLWERKTITEWIKQDIEGIGLRMEEEDRHLYDEIWTLNSCDGRSNLTWWLEVSSEDLKSRGGRFIILFRYN